MKNFKNESTDELNKPFKKYSQDELLQFYIDRYHRLLDENERLRETLRKYRGH